MGRLIGDDSLVTITFGGIQNPNGPNWGTPINIRPFGTGVKRSGKSKTVTFKAFGDLRDKIRVVSGSDDISLDLYIQSTGPIATGLEGYYARVSITPNSLTGSPEVYTGVLTEQSEDYPAGAEAKETLTIMCDSE